MPRRILLTLALVVSSLHVSGALAEEFRTWTDTTGKYHTEAKFVACKDGKVKLKQKNGAVAVVPLEKLSDVDQDFAIANCPALVKKTGKLLKKEVKELSNLASQLLGGGATAVVECYFLIVSDPATGKEETLALGQFSGDREIAAKPLIGKQVIVVGQYDQKEKRLTAVYRVSFGPRSDESKTAPAQLPANTVTPAANETTAGSPAQGKILTGILKKEVDRGLEDFLTSAGRQLGAAGPNRRAIVPPEYVVYVENKAGAVSKHKLGKTLGAKMNTVADSLLGQKVAVELSPAGKVQRIEKANGP